MLESKFSFVSFAGCERLGQAFAEWTGSLPKMGIFRSEQVRVSRRNLNKAGPTLAANADTRSNVHELWKNRRPTRLVLRSFTSSASADAHLSKPPGNRMDESPRSPWAKHFAHHVSCRSTPFSEAVPFRASTSPARDIDACYTAWSVDFHDKAFTQPARSRPTGAHTRKLAEAFHLGKAKAMTRTLCAFLLAAGRQETVSHEAVAVSHDAVAVDRFVVGLEFTAFLLKRTGHGQLRLSKRLLSMCSPACS